MEVSTPSNTENAAWLIESSGRTWRTVFAEEQTVRISSLGRAMVPHLKGLGHERLAYRHAGLERFTPGWRPEKGDRHPAATVFRR